MIRVWIAFAGWTLIIFGAIGLLALLWKFTLASFIINMIFISIGLLDLRNLRRCNQHPSRAYPQIAITQFILGLIIASSLAWWGLTFANSDLYHQVTVQSQQILGDTIVMKQALQNVKIIMSWGLPIGAAIILLSQVIVCWQLLRLAKQPPKL